MAPTNRNTIATDRLDPLRLSLFLHAQYFTGYGESFLLYNQTSDAFRVGFSIYR